MPFSLITPGFSRDNDLSSSLRSRSEPITRRKKDIFEVPQAERPRSESPPLKRRVVHAIISLNNLKKSASGAVHSVRDYLNLRTSSDSELVQCLNRYYASIDLFVERIESQISILRPGQCTQMLLGDIEALLNDTLFKLDNVVNSLRLRAMNKVLPASNAEVLEELSRQVSRRRGSDDFQDVIAEIESRDLSQLKEDLTLKKKQYRRKLNHPEVLELNRKLSQHEGLRELKDLDRFTGFPLLINDFRDLQLKTELGNQESFEALLISTKDIMIEALEYTLWRIPHNNETQIKASITEVKEIDCASGKFSSLDKVSTQIPGKVDSLEGFVKKESLGLSLLGNKYTSSLAAAYGGIGKRRGLVRAHLMVRAANEYLGTPYIPQIHPIIYNNRLSIFLEEVPGVSILDEVPSDVNSLELNSQLSEIQGISTLLGMMDMHLGNFHIEGESVTGLFDFDDTFASSCPDLGKYHNPVMAPNVLNFQEAVSETLLSLIEQHCSIGLLDSLGTLPTLSERNALLHRSRSLKGWIADLKAKGELKVLRSGMSRQDLTEILESEKDSKAHNSLISEVRKYCLPKIDE